MRVGSQDYLSIISTVFPWEGMLCEIWGVRCEWSKIQKIEVWEFFEWLLLITGRMCVCTDRRVRNQNLHWNNSVRPKINYYCSIKTKIYSEWTSRLIDFQFYQVLLLASSSLLGTDFQIDMHTTATADCSINSANPNQLVPTGCVNSST